MVVGGPEIVILGLCYDFENMEGKYRRDLCRVCLTHSKEMIDLQSKLKDILEEDTTFVFQALGRVLNKPIVMDTVRPSQICGICFSLLTLAYKFIVDCERAEKFTDEQFGGVKGEVEQLDSKACVELISAGGSFDVRDLLIVEEEDDSKPDVFNGFLNNLGTEISAVFVDGSDTNKVIKEPDDYSVSLIKFEHQQEIEQAEEETIEESCCQSTIPPSATCEDEVIRCKICNRIFKRKAYLVRHVKLAHMKDRSCLCQRCGYLAENQGRLRYHMESKHSEKKFKCQHCEKSFVSHGHLRVHALKHSKERTLLCNVCGKSFIYSNALEYHMRTHTGERRYKCNFCTKSFIMSSALKRHLLAHTGNRPYQCRYCEKAFRSTGERKCHEMLHTGVRPYHCKHCGKGFTKMHNLKVHLLSHTGKYRCKICDKTFLEAEYVKIHAKGAHLLVFDEC